MYFYYGITHSTLENPEEEIELKVDQNTYVTPPAQTEEHTAVWDRHGYENRMAGCWNSGNTINQGWGDQPDMGVNNNHSNGSYTTSSTSGRNANKPNAGTKSSSSSKQTDKRPPPPPAKKPASTTGKAKINATAPAPSTAASTAQTAPKKDGFGMFVQETQFPTWDD